jgi:hypothetical protein
MAFDTNFFRDILTSLCREVPEGERIWVRLKLASREGEYWIERLGYVGTGYVVCELGRNQPTDPRWILAVPYEAIDYVSIVHTRTDEPRPENAQGESFRVDPTTAN